MSDEVSVQYSTDEQVLETVVNQARVLAGGLPGALSRLTVTVGAHRVDIEWQAPTVVASAAPLAALGTVVVPESAVVAEPTIGDAVTAPLVGTFYMAPEPGAAPFVSVGDVVEAGQQLAIIEAMKIMNRIDAERAGKVVKILVGDGEMVEFGQELIFIDPDDLDSGRGSDG
jgi:acetyl-CoA carboxylase biotin carboxyl carrier protein